MILWLLFLFDSVCLVDVCYIFLCNLWFLRVVNIGWWVVLVILIKYLLLWLVFVVVLVSCLIWFVGKFLSLVLLLIIIIFVFVSVNKFCENCVVKFECLVLILWICCFCLVFNCVLVWIKCL